MKVRVIVEGQREILDEIQQIGESPVEAGKRAFGRITERVVPLAKADCPVESEDGGALRDSIRTTRPNLTRTGRVSAGVVAGGAQLARLASERGRVLPGIYGSIQEEDMTLHHSTGQAKFLGRNFLREAERAPDELRAELDEAIARARR